MSTKPKQLSGCKKRKIKEKKELELKKIKGSMNVFINKININSNGKFFILH